MKKIIIFIFVSLVLFFACEVDQEEPGDTTPPSKVHLIPHLGDAGDTILLTDDNNGIDAEYGSDVHNNIRIQWDETKLAMDGDISCIEIYRFCEGQNDTAKCIENILFDESSAKCVDTFHDLSDDETVIQKDWSYFIIPYDNAGNSTVSDTVTYQLIGTPGLQEPANNSTFSITDTVNFDWQPYGGYSFRILFFDEDGSLVFADDTYSDDEYSLSVLEFNPQLDTPYKWRIDAFGFVNSGSESEERRITFIQNKVD